MLSLPPTNSAFRLGRSQGERRHRPGSQRSRRFRSAAFHVELSSMPQRGFYTPTEVIDCDGAPRDRGRQARPITIDAKRKLIESQTPNLTQANFALRLCPRAYPQTSWRLDSAARTRLRGRLEAPARNFHPRRDPFRAKAARRC